MNRISVGNLETISSVNIVYLDQTSKYCVKVTGQRNDGSEQAGLLEMWDTFEEADICAKGIARMFDTYSPISFTHSNLIEKSESKVIR